MLFPLASRWAQLAMRPSANPFPPVPLSCLTQCGTLLPGAHARSFGHYLELLVILWGAVCSVALPLGTNSFAQGAYIHF